MRKIVCIIILIVSVGHSLMAYGLFCCSIVSGFLRCHEFLCWLSCAFGAGFYAFLCIKYILALESVLLNHLPSGHNCAKILRCFLCLGAEFLIFVFHCLIIASVIMKSEVICFGLCFVAVVHAIVHYGITVVAMISTYKTCRFMPSGIVLKCKHVG